MFRKRIFWIIVLALALVASGGGYYYYKDVYLQAQAPVEQSATDTATVTRGDLVISASGSGTLVPAKEVTVGFRNGGTLAEILVKAGDKVEAGQLLARLDNTDAQAQVSQAQISLRQAEISLAKLTENASTADLAAAQGNLASAKAALAALTTPASSEDVKAARLNLQSAQDKLDALLAGPDANTVASATADLTLAEINLQSAQSAYDQVASRPDVAMTSQATALWQATTSYDKAKATYDEAVKSATADEVASARAQVASAQSQLDTLLKKPSTEEVAAAQAQVDQAQAALDTLLAGTSASDLETAQLNVSQAQLSLDNAQRALDETQLTAPITGTVVTVDAQAGETVGTAAIITLADLQEPQIQFWVEETDLTSVVPGNTVSITFDALPDSTYPGKILSVDPALVTVSNTPAVQATASIDLSQPGGDAHPVQFLSGMNASVEVIAGEARNALLVPVEALREISPGQYAVFVVKADGQLEMRPVEVGLQDLVNAEIRSGLQEGEVVSLGTSTTTQSSSQNSNQQQFTPGGPVPFFGGG
jgi:HlyD family secretion protein